MFVHSHYPRLALHTRTPAVVCDWLCGARLRSAPFDLGPAKPVAYWKYFLNHALTQPRYSYSRNRARSDAKRPVSAATRIRAGVTGSLDPIRLRTWAPPVMMSIGLR